MAVIFGLIALISFIVASPIAQNDPAPHIIEGKTRFKNFLSILFNYWFILFLKQIFYHQKLDALPVITMPAFVGVLLYPQKPCICAMLGVHVNVYNQNVSYKFTWILLIVQICRLIHTTLKSEIELLLIYLQNWLSFWKYQTRGYNTRYIFHFFKWW